MALYSHIAGPVVGRFAPTPSGRMHLGNVYSCLMAWLGARSSGGHLVMRIEDLDPRAADRAVAQQLMDDLAWLGLDWDEGPVYQSERTYAYEAALAQLEAKDLVYPCFCTRAELHAATAPHLADGVYVYPGTCRDLPPEEVAARISEGRTPAVRLRVPRASHPDGIIVFTDLVCGPVRECLARECGDFLVRRSDGVFAYQLAVVVDDASCGVTQVVRGRDLLGSVARQVYLQRLLGLPQPAYAHVPLLVAPDGRRLSKRDHDLDLGVLRERGATAERIIGVLAAASGLLDAPEPLAAEELLGEFSWKKLVAAGDRITCDDALFAQLVPEA